MNYEIIQVNDGETTSAYVVITRDDGSKESFPADEDNPRYQQWLAEGNTAEVIED